MIRKELHLDEETLTTLEAEAKRQNRSLKNYLEFLAIEQARRLKPPSKAYRSMMDGILDAYEKGSLDFEALDAPLTKNDL